MRQGSWRAWYNTGTMHLYPPPMGSKNLSPIIWAFPWTLLGYNGSPGIGEVRDRILYSPYHTKPKPLASSRVDNLSLLEGKVMLANITCR